MTVAAAPIIGVAVSCSSTPATDSFKANSGVVGDSGISTTGFKDVVSKLNLSNTTTLSTLTNDSLNDLLKETDYKDLKLAIQDGSSEVTGTLKLKVTGTYNGKTYNDDITISNFLHLGTSSTFTVSDVKINKEEWFANGQPYSGSENQLGSLNENLDKQLITFKFNGTEIDFAELKTIANIQNANWKLSDDKTKVENISFELTPTSKQKEFKDGTWKEVNNNPSSLTQQNPAQVNLPIFKDLMQIVIDGLKIKKETTSKFYPSYFYGLVKFALGGDNNNDSNINENVLEAVIEGCIDDTDIQKYNQYSTLQDIKLDFSKSKDAYKADDFNGTFDFDITLTYNDITLNRKFNSSDFKKMDSSKIPEKITSTIQIKDNESNYFIKQFANAEFKPNEDNPNNVISQIEKVKSGETLSDDEQRDLENKTNKISNSFFSNGAIYPVRSEKEPDEDINRYIPRLNENLDFNMLNSQKVTFGRFQVMVKDKGVSFDYDSGLFNYDGNEENIFLISLIELKVKGGEAKDVKLEKVDDGVKLSFKRDINIAFNNKTITQTTTFEATIKNTFPKTSTNI